MSRRFGRGLTTLVVIAVLLVVPGVSLAGDRPGGGPPEGTVGAEVSADARAAAAERAGVRGRALGLAVAGAIKARGAHADGEHPGCHGIDNASARVAENKARNGNQGRASEALARVADRLGCNGDAVVEVEHPGGERPAHPLGKARGWESRCDRIAVLLERAQARPHGKSAEAFARQHARWGCATG